MIHSCTPQCIIPGENTCKRHYPMDFNENTYVDDHGKTHYRCRSPYHGVFTGLHHHRVLDNRYVVPYNPYLLLRFRCHINVEVCATIKACKYIFKYVYKGHDRAMAATAPVNTPVDEIQAYQDY